MVARPCSSGKISWTTRKISRILAAEGNMEHVPYIHAKFHLTYEHSIRMFGLGETICTVQSVKGQSQDGWQIAPAFAEWYIWYRQTYLVPLAIRRKYLRGYNYMKKPNVTNGKQEQGKVLRDESFSKKYPLITEYMTETRYDDGSARETSTLSLYVQDGGFGMSINDRDCQRSLYVVAGTLQEALGAIEKHLGKEDADWRSWKPRKGKYARS